MEINERHFMIEDQWNIIHCPYKPNGFGVMIIGDTNHYVDSKTSLWIQNSDRNILLKRLLDKGYTVFYSNYYGRHWGCPRALEIAVKLYHSVIKKEILNQKVHLLVEGMGGLLSMKCLEEMKECIRSVALISPCLYLQAHFEREKTTKLFYKRLIREIVEAYQVKEEEVPQLIQSVNGLCEKEYTIPTKIWHATNGSKYLVSDHSRCYEAFRNRNGNPIDLALHLPENRFKFNQQIMQFYNEHEKKL
jgi:hypothetical protein